MKILLPFLLLLLSSLNLLSASLDVADSSTRIGWAKAHLQVIDSTIIDGSFTAKAHIRVPLAAYDVEGLSC
jgi:hypothetical protein